MHRIKREFVNEVLIRKRPFPKLPALVSPPGGYAGITWTQSLPPGHANKAVEAGVHTRFVHSSIIHCVQVAMQTERRRDRIPRFCDSHNDRQLVSIHVHCLSIERHVFDFVLP